MLEELSKSFKAILYDRVVSPLSGAFILSWGVINWKVLALLFIGDETASARITNIESFSYMTLSWEGFIHLFFGPLISAMFFIFVYPFPSKWAYSFAKDRAEELLKIKQEKEKKQLLTEEAADEIRVQMERVKHEVASMIKEKDATIEVLNNKIKSLEMAANPQATSDLALKADEVGQQSKKRNEEKVDKVPDSGRTDANDSEYHRLKTVDFFNGFNKVIDDVLQDGGRNLSADEIQKYQLANIIYDNGNGYVFSAKGKRMAHLFSVGL